MSPCPEHFAESFQPRPHLAVRVISLIDAVAIENEKRDARFLEPLSEGAHSPAALPAAEVGVVDSALYIIFRREPHRNARRVRFEEEMTASSLSFPALLPQIRENASSMPASCPRAASW